MPSQSDLAYTKIKDMIFRMELLPGERIPELQIAARLSLGRTPIHDALRRLAAEGLVTVWQNRGAAVKEFTEDEIREIGAIRLSQDVLCALLASYYGSAADFDRLDALAEECEAVSAAGDVYGRIRTDSDFHLAIARIGGSRRLIAQQEAVYQQIHLIQVSKYVDIAQSLIQIHHHKPLAAAIRAGDRAQIRLLSCQHVKDFYRVDPFVLKCFAPE